MSIALTDNSISGSEGNLEDMGGGKYLSETIIPRLCLPNLHVHYSSSVRMPEDSIDGRARACDYNLVHRRSRLQGSISSIRDARYGRTITFCWHYRSLVGTEPSHAKLTLHFE